MFGLSGFLGKLWADRALEKQRHEYAQLTQQAQHQLDAALKRVQMELDTLGLIHNLRTKEEFNRLAELWKRIANLTDAIAAVVKPESFLPFVLADEEDLRKLKAKNLDEFRRALFAARQFFFEVMVFIPEPIATAGADTLAHAIHIAFLNDDQVGPKLDAKEKEKITERGTEEFYSGRNLLEQLIRKHIRGESLGKTGHPE